MCMHIDVVFRIDVDIMQDVNHQLFNSSVEEEVLLGISGDDEEAKEKKLVELLEEMDIQKYRDSIEVAREYITMLVEFYLSGLSKLVKI